MKEVVLFFLISFFYFFVLVPVTEAVTIFSPLIEMEVEPGQTQPGLVKVYNETDQNLYLASSVESFRAGDESGQPIYLPPEQKDIHLDWFKVAENELILKPGQVALVPFTVAVPAQATPGGYYAVIFWQTQSGSNEQKTAVGVASKVGTLILLKVKGELVEAGEIVEFATQPNQNYFFSLPIDFIIRFENKGNIHLKPVGEITLTNIFGQRESLPVNFQQRNVLPDSTRRFEIVWGQGLAGNWWQKFTAGLKQEMNGLALGRYKAVLSLEYGADQKKTVSNQISFWLIPYRLIITTVAAIFILIILFKINRKIKRIKAGEAKKI